MNNKGQVLVLFALLLPLIIMCVGLIIDTGLLYMEKRKLDLVVKDTVEYGIKKIDIITEEELYTLIDKNIENVIDKKVIKNNDFIKISVSLQKNSLFSFVFGKEKYEIKSTYKGMMEQGTIRIVRG